MFRFHKLLFTTFLAVLTGCKTSVSHNPLMESAGSFYSEKENKVFLHNSTITKEQTEQIELTQFSRKSQNVLHEHQLPTVQKLKNNKIFFNQNKQSPIKFKITQKSSQELKKAKTFILYEGDNWGMTVGVYMMVIGLVLIVIPALLGILLFNESFFLLFLTLLGIVILPIGLLVYLISLLFR